MEREKNYIKILSFTEYPGPRYCSQGPSSGEDFYHSVLNSAFEDSFSDNKILVVDLDGTAGFASSFLDEAFGNLVFDFTSNIVLQFLEIVSNQEADWKKMIFEEVIKDWEKRRTDDQPPKKTESHIPWFKLKGDNLIKRKWL